MVHITSKAIGKVALAATLLLGVAACAQPGGPPAATPTSSQMSLSPAPSTPPGSSAATATSGAPSSMGSMPGHDMSGMQGMDGMDAGDAATPQDPGQKKPEEGATKKLLKGLLRNL